ncbi:MCE family protein [Rhodococcus sp. NPDC058521]|uniref:MCE family protein n=1 Tax=Rhodococcus sp. NPDC058521 TaxID=3346536 RepID=UPI00365342B2
MKTRNTVVRVVSAVSVLALVLAGVWYVFGDDGNKRITAEFAYVNGIFAGSKVSVLGVPVGSVESVEPAGTVVRVVMSVPNDLTLPESVQSFVMNPSVISDRSVELGPAYTGGPTLADDAVIPVERNHSPINWDELMSSVDTLATALGPEGGDIGETLDTTARSVEGLGPEIRTSIRNLSQATSVIAGRGDDIGALIENLDRVTAAFAERRETVESVATSMSQIGDAVTEQGLAIGDTISELTVLFDRIDALVTERGGDIGRVLADSRTVTDQFARHEGDFAEFMDLVPLLMQNIDRMITPDQRARIRLNLSTTLSQFEVAKPLCDRYVVPLCEGAGMTNPISVPISTSDPLGLATFMQGGR